jgi:hypothetical protein
MAKLPAEASTVPIISRPHESHRHVKGLFQRRFLYRVTKPGSNFVGQSRTRGTLAVTGDYWGYAAKEMPMKINRRMAPMTLASRAAKFLALPFLLVSEPIAAQGLPVETASPIPLAIWFAGAFVLAGVIAYGIMHNRTRTDAEKRLTEQATKDNYAAEDRKARR